uniref:Uncharacterized protein n=1 Tax=Tanacetum cinerariifolium TaxID=118510 RepID=A0A699KXF6_TANCI|nr:hypothetical protein [Tanacetum cinerariifolium]
MLGLADSIRAGFVTTAFVRSYSGATPKRAAEVVGSSWVISLIITLAMLFIGLCALLIVGNLENEGMNLFVKWAGITLFLMLPSFIGTSILQAEQRFDKLLYVRVLQLGPAALAVYNLAQRFMTVVHLLIGSSVATAMPTLSNAYNQKDVQQFSFLLKKYIGGAKYINTEAANLLRISIALSIIFPIDRFSGIALDIINRPKINLIKVFIMVAVNIVFDFIGLYATNNIYGVALASIATVLSGALYGYIQINKDVKLTLRAILVTGILECKSILNQGLVFFKSVSKA